ncbi:RagB/SusD family nutrient uptake outer membrane protein [Pedobacter miscanthi]|uniref:RagB/SusD family nutrient uptake outer membrane protein n=1 Tax=Pedobacter miscanthi TaxID=2259170 RepID=UPI00292D1DF2|nr:RagB/SusD family nutrient uptake outer membrane protein [Pedobacter miscanthi]
MTIAILMVLASCKKFVDVVAPAGSIDSTVVYNNESSATAAVLSLYSNNSIRDNMAYMNVFGGLASDELNYFQTSNTYLDFQNNSLSPTNAQWSNILWLYPYSQIVNANADINGLQKAVSISAAIKNQLLGESKFWRAASYFNLVNCFGGVPLALSSAPLDNSLLPRASAEDVYAQIIRDLVDAKNLLPIAYPSSERARVNRYAASALLARVYLYHKDWASAQAEATAVIGSNIYTMSSPETTFQKTSNETIFQIYNLRGFTQWGVLLVPSSSTNITFHLMPGFVASFEQGDRRLANWVSVIGTSGKYSVNKYKLRTASAGNEYFVMLRLGEQYLIRAEARMELNNITGALEDLNTVRSRAGLAAKLNLSPSAAALAIEQERKVELFGEYSHRWFDLKRRPSLNISGRTRADDIIGALKTNLWQPTDILYPISATEIEKNPNLIQNLGY